MFQHQVGSTDNIESTEWRLSFLPQKAGMALENKEWFDDSFPHAEVGGLFIWPLHELPGSAVSFLIQPAKCMKCARSLAPDQIDKEKEKEESFAEVSIMI